MSTPRTTRGRFQGRTPWVVAGGVALVLLAALLALLRPTQVPAPPASPSPTPLPGYGPGHPSAGRALVFSDDFDSLDSIDLAGDGKPGHTWYTDLPFNWGSSDADWFSVNDGVLTINPSRTNNNYQLSSATAAGGHGKGFHYGYFEARMAFDPAHATGSDGFPAFWGVSLDQMLGGNNTRTMELDFFEAMHPSGEAGKPFGDTFAGTVHDLRINPEVDRANYGNNISHRPGTDWTQFHTYGCLWERGVITWYLDEVPVLQQRYSADAEPRPNPQGLSKGIFSPLDSDTSGQVVILGTGNDYPLKVDWVRVHQ